jgi:hypothetical protein
MVREALFSTMHNECPATGLILLIARKRHPDSGRSKPRRFKIPVKKTFLAGLLALCLAPVGAMAQVVVRVAPPVPMHERHDQPPHPGWVWVDGYHRWDGHHYVWVHGYWAHPPHPGGVWVAHRWERHGDGWVLVEGHWR